MTKMFAANQFGSVVQSTAICELRTKSIEQQMPCSQPVPIIRTSLATLPDS